MALIMNDQSGIMGSENSGGLVNEGTSEKSRNLVDQAVMETAIVIRSDEVVENGNSSTKPGKVGEEVNLKIKDLEDEKHSCVVDLKSRCGASGGAGDGEGFERVCRICQLSPEAEVLSEKTSGACIKEMDLIQLGCGCKEGMSIAHSHCAETWFRLKGNRVCEICGEAAKNITGIRDQRMMEEWNEVRLNVSETSQGFWHGKPLCNILIGFLVLAIILPWFLHVTWPF